MSTVVAFFNGDWVQTSREFAEEHNLPIQNQQENVQVQHNNIGQVAANANQVVQANIPIPRQGILAYNILSIFWSRPLLEANPYISITAGAILWPSGMIGYILALPIRIVIFVVVLIKTIAQFFIDLRQVGLNSQLLKNMKPRMFVLAGAFGELVSGAVGCAIPVIGYKMDEWIQSNQDIHNFYGKIGLGVFKLSVWLAQAESLDAKKEKFKNYIEYAPAAKSAIVPFHEADYADVPMPNVLQEILTVTILLSYQNGLDLNKIKNEISNKKGDVKAVKLKLESYISEIEKNWNDLHVEMKKFDQGQKKEEAILNANIADLVLQALILTQSDLKKEKTDEIEKNFKEISESQREKIKAIAKNFEFFGTDITCSDPGLLSVITQAAFPQPNS